MYLQVYELCSKFKCLPSQLDQESQEDIDALLIIHNEIGAYESKQDKKQRRSDLKNKVGGGSPRR